MDTFDANKPGSYNIKIDNQSDNNSLLKKMQPAKLERYPTKDLQQEIDANS